MSSKKGSMKWPEALVRVALWCAIGMLGSAAMFLWVVIHEARRAHGG